MQSTAVPLDGGNLFRVVRGMEKQGRIHEALALLRESCAVTRSTPKVFNELGGRFTTLGSPARPTVLHFGSSYSGNSRRLG